MSRVGADRKLVGSHIAIVPHRKQKDLNVLDPVNI
jgi:hypothetical protein